jgi:starch synthase (maltosyl-transferring)
VHPSRVVVENLRPAVDRGRFPAKRCLGDRIEVTADVHADGHDLLRAVLRWRGPGETDWREDPMEPLPNDVWRGSFPAERLGAHEFRVEAWVDRFGTWRRDLLARFEAGQEDDLAAELIAGSQLVSQASDRATGAADRTVLLDTAAVLADRGVPISERVAAATAADLLDRMDRHADREPSARSETAFPVQVDPVLARFSSWYEMFPRSGWGEAAVPGTLRGAADRLDEIARMGFDVLYLPPIHPIGRSGRKGPNNAPVAGPDDPGSPWAIGSGEGGHTSVHPELGTVADLERLVEAARSKGIEIALDLAFQCSPDHPWVVEHPVWFRKRPDGSIRYAENPPKKYQDIYPLDFECEDWKGLWEALRGVVAFWIERGVRVFRVDNPHTKPFAFWDWLLAEVRRERPDVIFLSEAFTRPKVMARLAKAGFHQSYTYFTWRNTAGEIRGYLEDLRRAPLADFFRPNFWPNTPDILPEFLQAGGPAAFRLRLVLAATLSTSYGIYGPAYELCEAEPIATGREEYNDSEKYERKSWDVADAKPIRALATRLNRIRKDNPALQTMEGLRFHETDRDELLAYSRRDATGENLVVVVVNLDPHHRHSGYVTLDGLGLDAGGAYQVHDLLGGARFLWTGERNFVELDPAAAPAHVLRVRRRVRTEKDFDYFL